MEWMILPFKRFAEFKGRSRRQEYWMFTLFSILVTFGAGVVDFLLGFAPEDNGRPTRKIRRVIWKACLAETRRIRQHAA